jgi:uncharacterized protein YbjT (DUF2867 family)
MAESKPVIVVVGGTGAQGGSVVRALLKDGKYRVKAITRDSTSDKAKQLTAQGVEVIKASIDDKAAMTKACEGAWGVFGGIS